MIPVEIGALVLVKGGQEQVPGMISGTTIPASWQKGTEEDRDEKTGVYKATKGYGSPHGIFSLRVRASRFPWKTKRKQQDSYHEILLGDP